MICQEPEEIDLQILMFEASQIKPIEDWPEKCHHHQPCHYICHATGAKHIMACCTSCPDCGQYNIKFQSNISS